MTRNTKTLLTLLWIGLVAGTLDISENLIYNEWCGLSPTRVFQFIASGLIEMKAFSGGAAAVALGVAIHYTIALFWTVVFYDLSRKMAVLRRRPVLSGLCYGGLVYLVMNFIVLSLTAVPPPRNPIPLISKVNAVLALLLCIGLPISLLVRRFTPADAQNFPGR